VRIPDAGRLRRLHDVHGQSPWLDNLRRGWITSGHLAALRDAGVRGLTSNPSIFQKAIAGSSDYDEQFASLVRDGADAATGYWALVSRDIDAALDVFAPVHEASGGEDGWVSLEVDPDLAHDASGTLRAARGLAARIDRPNLMIKVPATREALPAIRTLVAEGCSINVTLIFGVERYRAVAEAYLAGLEDLAQRDPARVPRVGGVASFFVSRVDTEVDRRLEAIGGPALGLRGLAAVAQARLAYAAWAEIFAGPRWHALARRGARVQRPLWASTSTKNPAYPDTRYVDALIGPSTVNTLPDATLEAFADHGTLARTIDADPAGAAADWARIADAGVDLAAVSEVLEREGVLAFQKSFVELLDALKARAADLPRP
jgi:transaldolase